MSKRDESSRLSDRLLETVRKDSSGFYWASPPDEAIQEAFGCVLGEADKEIDRLSDLLLKNGVCPVCGAPSRIGWENGQYWHYCENGHTQGVDKDRIHSGGCAGGRK